MKTCPNCHIELDNMKLLIHERYCRENIKYCAQCKEAIPKEEFEEHINNHLSRKNTKEIKKEDNKEEKNNKEEIKKEVIKREESERIECQYCGELMSYKLLDEHEEICGSRTDDCDICGKIVLKRKMKNHLKNHEFENNMKLKKLNFWDLRFMNEDEQLARAMAESMFY